MPKIRGNMGAGRKIFVIILLIAVAFGLFQLGKMSVKDGKEVVVDTDKKTETKDDINTNEKVTATSGKITEDSKKFSINVTYPILSGIENKNTQDKINSTIKNNVNSKINQFKEDVNSGNIVSLESGGQNEVTGDYKFSGNYKGIVSVEERLSEFSPGGAHPNNYSTTYSFYTNTGDVVENITDLCVDKNNCLPTLAKITQKHLKIVLDKMKVGTMDWTNEGSSAKLDNYQDFMVLESGLQIVFDPYLVAPYSAGTIYVTIPWGELADIVKAEYIK